MKTIIYTILFGIGFLISISCIQKNKNKWNITELRYYETLKGLCTYVSDKEFDNISKETLFEEYIYFDNVLSDPDSIRKNRRIKAFDTIFQYIPKTIDSLGIENLEAKPIRFYKGHEIFQPFEKVLKGTEDNVFVYYLKDNEKEPMGYLLFEEESGKLASWVLLNQGDKGWFFLTFNLL